MNPSPRSVAWNQIRAIAWAQWRSSWNRLPGVNKGSAVLTVLIAAFWYGGVTTLAVFAAVLMAQAGHQSYLLLVLNSALFLMFVYWQFVPVIMASTGSVLDLRKLLVYPIPRNALFGLEVLLRVTTGVEILMVLTGAIVGSLFNRRLPLWSSLGFVLFIALNLLLAAGVRDLMVRLFAKRRIREIAMFLLVTVAALPQLLLTTGAGLRIRAALSGVPTAFLPWDATAVIASGRARWWTPLVLLGWIGAAWVFGRIQFERSIAVEVESTATETSTARGPERFAFFYTWPARLVADPLAALVEKELRILTRSSRFRVVFVMGFTFGLLIWLPMSLGSSRHAESFIAQNFLTIVSAYAVMLLTDLLFFNSFGPDRGAAQIYYLVPVRLEWVFLAKNAAAAFFALAEVAIITFVCLVFRLPLTPVHVIETFSVCLVMCVFLLGLGNLASIWNPRPMNMAQPFKNQGSRVQWMALVAFPVACLPVAIAYLARFAFNSEAGFFGVLIVFGSAGVYAYSLAIETAARYGVLDRERIIGALSRQAGVIST
jgi:ABC-2 type transport system permease protein